MSTEAKIKHIDLEAIEREVAARRRHARGGGMLGTQSDRGLLEACEETDLLIAELRRNRRLLEAGERLIQATRDAAAVPFRCVPLAEYDALVAAYQETAKA